MQLTQHDLELRVRVGTQVGRRGVLRDKVDWMEVDVEQHGTQFPDPMGARRESCLHEPHEIISVTAGRLHDGVMFSYQSRVS